MNNNVFILRSLIEQFRFKDDILSVAFINILNVFPSSPHAGLWARLEAHKNDWYLLRLAPHAMHTDDICVIA